jgi:hypothetical protein
MRKNLMEGDFRPPVIKTPVIGAVTGIIWNSDLLFLKSRDQIVIWNIEVWWSPAGVLLPRSGTVFLMLFLSVLILLFLLLIVPTIIPALTGLALWVSTVVWLLTVLLPSLLVLLPPTGVFLLNLVILSFLLLFSANWVPAVPLFLVSATRATSLIHAVEDLDVWRVPVLDDDLLVCVLDVWWFIDVWRVPVLTLAMMFVDLWWELILLFVDWRVWLLVFRVVVVCPFRLLLLLWHKTGYYLMSCPSASSVLALAPSSHRSASSAGG